MSCRAYSTNVSAIVVSADLPGLVILLRHSSPARRKYQYFESDHFIGVDQTRGGSIGGSRCQMHVVDALLKAAANIENHCGYPAKGRVTQNANAHRSFCENNLAANNLANITSLKKRPGMPPSTAASRRDKRWVHAATASMDSHPISRQQALIDCLHRRRKPEVPSFELVRSSNASLVTTVRDPEPPTYILPSSWNEAMALRRINSLSSFACFLMRNWGNNSS